MNPTKGFECGMAIDEKWGKETAKFLAGLSRPRHKWETAELGKLADAARRGWKVYEQTYFMLRPAHRSQEKRAAD
jgi:hypothetical protein